MPCSLTSHPQQYWLSPKEICLTAIGFTGAPYAGRHLDLSRQESPWTTSRMAHRAIFLIECMPIVGGCIALAEGIFHACFKSSSPIGDKKEPPAVTATAPLTVETAPHASATTPAPTIVAEPEPPAPAEEKPPAKKDPIQRMNRNLEKAVREAWKRQIETLAYKQARKKLGNIKAEHGNEQGLSENDILKQQLEALEKYIHASMRTLEEDPSLKTAYIQLSELPMAPTDPTQKEPIPLKLPTKISKELLVKSTLHAQFYLQIGNDGSLAGIFKGHNGKEVAQFARDAFQTKFPDALNLTSGNVHKAFERVIHEIQAGIATNPTWNTIWSTAVICYVDKETHLIYTATIGEGCQANIYRQMGTVRKSIPLYLERNWLSRKDRARLTAAFSEEMVTQHIRTQEVAKLGLFLQRINDFKVSHAIRSGLSKGTHHSRAFGYMDDPLVVPKAKVTICKLQEGDKFVLSSGLKDFLSEEEIASIISTEEKSPDSALVRKALGNMAVMKKMENITVRVFKVLHSKK